jgi:aspartyl-tRNA(Asn)/glutamyl-tRNA(Gln) amidotransferase subunit A
LAPVGNRRGEVKDTVIDLAAKVRDGEYSATDALEECRVSAEANNREVNAFVFLDWDGALRVAAAVDAKVAAGIDPGPLAGVPFGVKDIENCAGMPTTFGSIAYKDVAPAGSDDPNIGRLRRAGAIPVGKTATPEFAFDSLTDTPAWGTTRNPWDLSKTPGGSSGGSAAAVSAGIVPFATGTDEGGSVRSPAAFCGLVGLKPTHGLVARLDGGSDTNTMSALACTVSDTARLLDIMAARDDIDKMSQPVPWLGTLESRLLIPPRPNLRAVWSKDLGYAPVEAEVAEIAEQAATRLAEVATFTLERNPVVFTNANDAWMPIVTHRIRSRLEYLDLWPQYADQMARTPREWLEQHGTPTPRQYGEALALRDRVESEVNAFFVDHDLLLTPTVACAAFDARGPIPDVIDGRDASATGAEAFTMFANLAWVPAISIPAGVTKAGLPVGLQVVGRRWTDDLLLQLALSLERAYPWPRHAPMASRVAESM